MKRLVLFLMMCLGLSFVAFPQNNDKFASCMVIEKKNKVEVKFSPEVKYLGTNYEKNVLYEGRKKLKFNDGQSAVSYLSASWSWILCGNPTQLEDGEIMWVLKHEIDNNIANYVRNMRALETARKRYYNNNSDEVYIYFDYDDSH